MLNKKYENLKNIIKSYESGRNNIKSGEILTADGKDWILISSKANPTSYRDFEIAPESDRSKVYKGDVLKFLETEQIYFASFKTAEGNILNLYPAYHIYNIAYERGIHLGDLYIGAINDDLEKSGRGLYYYTSMGDIYYGDFYKDDKTGSCEFLFAYGGSYSGGIRNGKTEGRGTFKWADGSEYSGSFSDNMKNGFGTYIFDDGTIYEND